MFLILEGNVVSCWYFAWKIRCFVEVSPQNLFLNNNENYLFKTWRFDTWIAMGIVSLVFGIQSVQRFKSDKNYGVKPVPTLVLGIVGIVSATFTLLFCSMFFLIVIYI